MKISRISLKLIIATFVLLFAVTGCDQLFPPEMSCGFSFDMHYDNQNAVVLDYVLDGEMAGIDSAPRKNVEKGMKFYREGIGYQYDRPTSLYVKWRDEQTENVHETKVELKDLLPKKLKGSMLYFMLRGSKIFIYLVFLDENRNDGPKIGSEVYGDKVNIQIYPSLNKNN